MTEYKKLHNRVIDISYAKQLSHISSCVTTLPLLHDIYKNKNANDIVILSNGHAGLAQYVCMEYFEGKDAVKLFDKYGVHPERNILDGIFATTGSLGLGLPIAIGAAMSNPDNMVWCIISDGECCEGSIWECLYYISKTPIPNLKIFVNANGYSAYDEINIARLTDIINAFMIDNIYVFDTSCVLDQFEILNSSKIEAHYIKIQDENESTALKFKL